MISATVANGAKVGGTMMGAASVGAVVESLGLSDPISLVNWGIGGAVIAVVVLFLRYMKDSSERAQRYATTRDDRFLQALDQNAERHREALQVLANSLAKEMALTRENVSSMICPLGKTNHREKES